jgi:hypothetical protein
MGEVRAYMIREFEGRRREELVAGRPVSPRYAGFVCSAFAVGAGEMIESRASLMPGSPARTRAQAKTVDLRLSFGRCDVRERAGYRESARSSAMALYPVGGCVPQFGELEPGACVTCMSPVPSVLTV